MKKQKNLVFFLLLLVITVSTAASASEATGTLIQLKKDWSGGEFSGVVANPDQSGTLILEPANGGFLSEGTYLSKIIELPAFNRIVPSWNAITPEGTYIKVDVQFRVKDQWSGYLTMGEWGSSHMSASKSDSLDLGYTSIDTIIINEPADAMQLKLTLYGTGTATPSVTLVSAVAFMNGKDPGVPVAVTGNFERELEVPRRSQMIEDPEVAGRICSPTSLAMVLEYYGINKTTKEVYDLTYDNGAKIYGNWPYNTAVAGSFGLEAYVDYYFSIDEIKQRIAEGIPVICSIKFNRGQLTGAPISSTSGHLIVAIGFITRDGQEYVICNDPAAPDNETVRREYSVSQFVRAWKKWVYIIKKPE